jgi:hypothetical protein
MELLGAVQDARSIRVLLDVQQALSGDPDAEHRLRVLATSGQAEDSDATQACLGLAHLAWQRERYDEALAFGDAATRIVDASTEPAPHPRILSRVAVAVMRLWAADVRTTPDPEDSAATLLTLARDEVLATHDSPLLGTWALGGAELAAFRGDAATARGLWALSSRMGAHWGVLFPFPPGERGRLGALLGDEEQRDELLAAVPTRSMAVAGFQIRELMAALLA